MAYNAKKAQDIFSKMTSSQQAIARAKIWGTTQFKSAIPSAPTSSRTSSPTRSTKPSGVSGIGTAARTSRTATTTPTAKPTSQTSSKTLYGDVKGYETGRTQYTGEWAGISWGKAMTDVSKFWGIQWTQGFDKFGGQAEEAERLNPWFLAKRNDVYGMDILKQTQDYQNLTDQDKDRTVRDYLKSRDVDGTLFTWTRGEQDVVNTIASVRARLGEMQQAPEPSQEEQMVDRATGAYDRDIADIESQYDAEKNEFLRAWAVEDRYTNFNEVNESINNTMLVAWQHRADNLYTGMPTDEQIAEIAQQSGNDFATTKQILEGRGFEKLEMQDEFGEKSSRGYNRQMDDLETNRGRAITDTDTSHMRTQTALNEQIDDVQRTMERNVSMWEKSWALSWAIRSSWYMQGLDNIRDDALRNIDRLSTRKERDTEDTAKMKTRISDDYNTNITRSKQDLETQLNSIKTQNGAELNQYLMEYAPSSEELTRKLNDIDEKFAVESQQAFNMYLSNLRWITDTLTYDTEKMLELQGTQQELQQTNVSNLLQNNWAALSGMNYQWLSEMLQNGTISPTDYSTMTWYMNTLGVSALQSMWVPTQQDLQMYNSFLDQDMTPSQAINAVAQQSWGRLSMAATADIADWKLNSQTWEYYRTWANWQIEFADKATAEATAQATYTPPQYDAADTSDMQNWEVFLYNSKVWSDWGQCGSYVNDYLQSMGIDRLFVDPISAKMAVKNSDIAVIGSVAIIDRSNSPNATDEQKTYWHVGIVQSINDDWTITIRDSNHSQKQEDGTYKWDEKVHEWNIVESKVTGYFDPTKWSETVQAPIEEAIAQQEYNMTDIFTYNNSTFKPQTSLKTPEAKAKYEQYLHDRDAVMSDPDAKLSDILDFSAGGKDLTDGAITRIDKYSWTLTWIWELQKMFEKAGEKSSWPIQWYFAKINPYNTDAQAIKSKLTSLIPWLARWVYWEVWVLTDRDVALYSQTIPNLTQTEDVQKAVLWMTLRTISNWYKDILQSQAAAGRDVSWYAWMLERINRMAFEIEEDLWMNTEAGTWEWNINDIR